MEPAPFQFRLERVRELRAGVEDAARERLAGALAHLSEGEAQAAAADARVRGALATQRDAGDAPLSGSDLMGLQAWRERTERGRLDAAADLRTREHAVHERRTEMLAAAREREILERLKRRRAAEHALDEERAAAAAIDDLAQARYVRGRR